MRVVFNLTAAWELKTGVGHHALQLFRHLRKHARGTEVVAYPNRWLWIARKAWERIRPAGKALVDARAHEQNRQTAPPVLPRFSLKRLRRWGRGFLDRHRATTFFGGGYDLYHEPNFLPEPSNCFTIATFHDLSALLHPEWHPAERNAWYQENLERSLKQCQHFLAVSEFTRQQVIRFLGVAPERVTRVYNGTRPDCRPLPPRVVARRLRRLGLPDKYLLFVGTVEPRKNVLRLLQAYCALPAALRREWPLLLAGPWGWNAAPIANYYHAEAQARGVRHLGYVADRDLVALYNGARALVYPSLYEGFGLPVVEMMACGGAVIASTAEALREVAGGRGHLVDPEDVDALKAALSRVVTDNEWQQSLRRGTVEWAGTFTWDRAAKETLETYQKLGGVAFRRQLAA